VILNALPVQMPRDVVCNLVHHGRHVAAAAAHVLSALHADAIKAGRAPGVGAVIVLRDHWAWHLVVLAHQRDEHSTLSQT
jgi:hypothetical protein